MTTTTSDLMTAAAARTVPIVWGIRDEQLFDATPCSEFAVRDLLNHLFLVVINFQALATGGAADFTRTPDVLTADWRDRFATETQRLAEAWSDPSTLEGDSSTLKIPQAVAANLPIIDLLVHGWDLAEATGQPYHPDPAVVTALKPTVEQMSPIGHARGIFAEPQPCPPDAPAFAQLLTLTGRKPT
jgi:uncharacterized protein (TIGR03086 family)